MRAPLAAPLVVCPKCQYGFVDQQPDTAEDHVCPRGACGYRWHADTATLRAVHGCQRRHAHPELSVVAGAPPQRFELPEGETLIGRAEGCGFRLDNRNVSRKHACIRRISAQTTIEDVGSGAGVYVNGELVERPTLLQPGDELLLGGVTLEFAVRFSADRPIGVDLVDSPAALASAAGAMPCIRGQAGDVIDLDTAPLTFGRAATRDVVFADPMISACHAVLTRESDGYYLSDTQSLVGTYVNGRSVIRSRLEPGDRIQFGPYVFVFEGERLVRVRQLAAFAMQAVGLTQTAGAVTLLDKVSLDVRPGEFVGLLGPSGAGKTTLLDALSGLRPAASGRVLVNGANLYEQYDRLRHQIGYVPQDDIIHRELTVRQALEFAARLRLPGNAGPAEVDRLIHETLNTLDLDDQAEVPIGRLSGGQRKRVSVGVELLSKPGILYLDEPTSGLDPATESRLMRKFRQLADQGRTVVCTTHVMENVDLFDQVVVLAPRGKLAYCGPPAEARAYFGIDKFALLYERIEEKPAGEWQSQFARTERGRALGLLRGGTSDIFRAGRRPARPRSSFVRQLAILWRRHFCVLTADKSNVALLAAQPLAIAALICIVCRELLTVFFLLVVSAIWFGCSNAAQQIVKERAVYRRERMVTLRLDAYLASKFLPLAAISGLQSALMLGIAYLCEDFQGSLAISLAALVLAALAGAAMGLVISTLATNTDRAMSVVPLSLIPQIVLAGVIVALPGMNRPTRAVSCLVVSRWANEAAEIGLLQGRTIDAELLSDPSRLRPLWNLYPRYNLFKAESRQRFMADHGGQTIAKESLLMIDFGALCLFVGVQLALAATVLKNQDPF